MENFNFNEFSDKDKETIINNASDEKNRKIFMKN